PGTVAAKGDPTADRPHRGARILDAPPRIEPMARATLDHIAALRPADPPRPARRRGRDGAFDVRVWLAAHGLTIVREKPWMQGAAVLELAACVFTDAHEHHRGEAAVILLPSGMLLYRCQHATCAGREWSHVRDHLDGSRPAAATRRASRASSATASDD